MTDEKIRISIPTRDSDTSHYIDTENILVWSGDEKTIKLSELLKFVMKQMEASAPEGEKETK